MNKNIAYQELNGHLDAYLKSTRKVHIDRNVKDEIWKKVSKEVHEKELRKKYWTRRSFKVAITICLLIATLVSIDLSSNASLFKRLLASVSGNTVQLDTRGLTDTDKIRIDEELEQKVEAINAEEGSNFITPILIDSYFVDDVVHDELNLIIYLVNDDDRMMQISQKQIREGNYSGFVKYNDELLDIEVLYNNGLEYRMARNNDIMTGFFELGGIEFEVAGEDSVDIDKIITFLQNKYFEKINER